MAGMCYRNSSLVEEAIYSARIQDAAICSEYRMRMVNSARCGYFLRLAGAVVVYILLQLRIGFQGDRPQRVAQLSLYSVMRKDP